MAARALLEVPPVPRDVVLFYHDRTRFFRLAGLFCAGQGLFWAYLGYFAFTALRPPPGTGTGTGTGTDTDTGTDPDQPLRPRDNKWRFGFTASCLTVGSLTVAAGCLVPLRSVRRVTLLRGGSHLSIQTHGPLGLGRGPSLSVPVGAVSAGSHRAEARAALPLRLRGRRFFFLLDKRGHIADPALFDITVGARRRL